MNRVTLVLLLTIFSAGIFFITSSVANELVRGKVVELTDTKLVVRLSDGQKKTIYLKDSTKFMHRPGSGEQSEPPKPRRNDRIAASLEGGTAMLVVVEEIPK